MNDSLKALVFAVVFALVGAAIVVGIASYNTTVLPMPPDFTNAEMIKRMEDFGSAHIAACKACTEAMENTPNLPPPPCYLRARVSALVVGDWVAIGCKADASGMLWQYVGRPINGFRWSPLGQCWKINRRGPAK